MRTRLTGPSRRSLGNPVKSRKGSDEPIRIKLSRSQVDQLVHDASDTGSLSALFRGLGEGGQTVDSADRFDDRRLSASLLIGLMLFAVFPSDGTYVKISHTARQLQLNAGTAHRYVRTLYAVGLLERDPVTRQYRRAL